MSVFLSIAIYYLPVQSQNNSLSEIKAQLDILFSDIDKTKVATGFLWDTSVNLVEREDFNGTALTDSNCVSVAVMGDLLYADVYSVTRETDSTLVSPIPLYP